MFRSTSLITGQLRRFTRSKLMIRSSSGGGIKLNPEWPHDHYIFGKRPESLQNMENHPDDHGWQGITAATTIAFFVIAIIGLNMDHPLIEDWAIHEAIARDKFVAEGGQIEYGKYYWKPESTELQQQQKE